MTRINVGVLPSELSDKHLLAEHREIKRIPNMVASGKAKIEGIPEKFTLGKGHVKFFYNKLEWLHYRYQEIYKECLKRGFNVSNYNAAFNGIENCKIPYSQFLKLYNNWYPENNEVDRIRKLIIDRINTNEELSRLKKAKKL